MFDIKPTLFTGKCFIDLLEVDSTNTYAQNLLKQNNVAEGTVVSTFNQTKGKGNANNQWLSKIGENLSFSIIYKPTFLLARQQFYLNMAICLGVIDALATKAHLTIKWPNDVYYKNYKIGGLLIENILSGKHLKYSVIGLGLNINQTIFDDVLPNPSSLKLINQKAYDLYELISDILVHIEKRYLQLKALHFETLKNDYLANLYLYKQPAKFKVDNKIVTAIIKGIDESGQLLLQVDKEVKAFSFKAIGFVV